MVWGTYRQAVVVLPHTRRELREQIACVEVDQHDQSLSCRAQAPPSERVSSRRVRTVRAARFREWRGSGNTGR
ncbi:hypothetical protein ACFW4K_02650 [Nocardiopsis alba]|uniref:hypothetical protein n=1 Tax=Nocardiopsis alba TaxID=53437 RepID=UPI00366EDF2D